jgi:hypothetical protein
MFFRIKKLTTDIYELQIGQESSFSTALLSQDEIRVLREVLRESFLLPVAKTAERWYND